MYREFSLPTIVYDGVYGSKNNKKNKWNKFAKTNLNRSFIN